MKKSLMLASFLAFFLCGCGGHNWIRADRGTGFMLRIPLPNGDSLIEIKGGEIDSTTAVLRGGSQFSSGRAVGGSLNNPLWLSDKNTSETPNSPLTSGGSANDLQFSSCLQLNEGNIRDILTSPNVSTEAKIKLIEYLSTTKPNAIQPHKTTTVGASTGKGGNLKSIEIETPKTKKNAVNYYSAVIMTIGVIIFLSSIIILVATKKNRSKDQPPPRDHHGKEVATDERPVVG